MNVSNLRNLSHNPVSGFASDVEKAMHRYIDMDLEYYISTVIDDEVWHFKTNLQNLIENELEHDYDISKFSPIPR
jgi:hypothetical protein